LTKICDQVVSLLSPEQSASIIWNDEPCSAASAESADLDVDDGSDRLYTFVVAETNEQEENAVMRPGFQVPFNPSLPGRSLLSYPLKMTSQYISASKPPGDCPVDPALLAPRLLSGETTHGFWTAAYVSQQTHSENLDGRTFTLVALKQLL
jgi:hypothetical protein